MNSRNLVMFDREYRFQPGKNRFQFDTEGIAELTYRDIESDGENHLHDLWFGKSCLERSVNTCIGEDRLR